ncbi:hypothetical protein [Palleronia abyssalis]|uniref:Uncharacterized protein n=1 Tax=Palleronia abyssalis TaxID=1501240 RepID=A0A2R8BYY2_9RHOB|nr:hypothetical protein [Palleronia abyssalis]SPJ25378.1 hypothetical protein PAA8504_03229 [Palleronia abyssalis]
MRLSSSTSLAAFLLLGPGAALAQSDEMNARRLVVDAFRAHELARSTENPAIRLQALREGVEYLDRIEANLAATEAGLHLITGGTFNEFIPSALRTAYEEAQSNLDDIAGSCLEDYTAVCLLAVAEIVFPEAEISPSAMIVGTVGTETWDDTLREWLPRMDEDEFMELLSTLWSLGRGPEMIELSQKIGPIMGLEAAPEPDMIIASLPRMYDTPLPQQPPTTAMNIDRMVEAGYESPHGAIMASGSSEDVRAMLAGIEDPDAVDELVVTAYESFGAASYTSGRLLAAYADVSDPNTAMNLVQEASNYANEGFELFVREAPDGVLQSGMADLVLGMAPETNRRTAFWYVVGGRSADDLSRIVTEIRDRANGNIPLGFGTRESAYSQRWDALYAGITSGELGRNGILDVLGDLPESVVDDTERAAFYIGEKVARIRAGNPPSPGILDDLYDLEDLAEDIAPDAAWELVFALVETGHMELARQVAQATEDMSAGNVYSATLSAAVGNLGTAISLLQSGNLDDVEWVASGIRAWFETPEGSGADVADLLTFLAAMEDADLRRKITREIALPGPSSFGAPQAIYRAAIASTDMDLASDLFNIALLASGRVDLEQDAGSVSGRE